MYRALPQAVLPQRKHISRYSTRNASFCKERKHQIIIISVSQTCRRRSFLSNRLRHRFLKPQPPPPPPLRQTKPSITPGAGRILKKTGPRHYRNGPAAANNPTKLFRSCASQFGPEYSWELPHNIRILWRRCRAPERGCADWWYSRTFRPEARRP